MSWEIEIATTNNTKIDYFEFLKEDYREELEKIYNYKDEFESCFQEINSDQHLSNQNFEIYKKILDTSESLIQRRQTVNSFFITLIGTSFTVLGLMIKFSSLQGESLWWVMLLISIFSSALCFSWYNMLDNYGKLNQAKYQVVSRIEQELTIQAFNAEWFALGAGNRPEKYKSFTKTEEKIPIVFLCVYALLFIYSFYELFMQVLHTLDIWPL